MTREEAINIVKYYRDLPIRKDDKKALDMAIKSLEQQPILDKIRAEIEQEYNKYRNMSEKWNERACGVGITLEIIDKYRKVN